MVELKPIPKDYNDDLFTIAEFRKMCDERTITDDDGHGVYATIARMTDLPAEPSLFCMRVINHEYTHVLWFNK